MKTIFLFIAFAFIAAANLRSQIDETGANYESFDSLANAYHQWVQFQNNTGQTINLQILVIASNGQGQNAWWMGFEGEPGIPTTDNIAPGATFWLATTSYPSGFSSIWHWRSIADFSVVATNHPPTAAISGSMILEVGEVGTWNFSAADQDGNLASWRFYASTNPNPQWSPASGGTAGPGSYSVSFSSPGTYTWIVEAQDAAGTGGSDSITVTVTAPVNHAPTIAWTATPGTVASGQNYTVSAQGHDQDGNLTQVNIWRDGAPYAFAGGGTGTDSDSGNPSTDTGPQTITYTAQAVDTCGATSATISQTVTVSAPPPVNRAPTVVWTSTPGTVASGQSYTVAAHGNDEDGNLSQIIIWKSAQLFATAAASGTDGNAGNSSSDIGPQTLTFTAQAFDSEGASSGTISQTVTVSAPPPVQSTLLTSAGVGGSVSPGGTYNLGTVAAVSATPDAIHDFAGWSGDVAGLANPVAVTLDRNKAVQANFSLKNFLLATSASGGGSVTSGGTYPYGAIVTLTASPDAESRFLGWAGDATGPAPSVAVTMNAPRNVQALFAGKTAQTISFVALTDRSVDSAAFPLGATASSGLPVSYAVLSGPATLSGVQLQLTGPGAVTVEASQPGDAIYLPAPSVAHTFNAITSVVLKYRPAARTLLQRDAASGPTSLVLEKP